MLTDISSRQDLVRIIPFGGAGEIGMNLLAIEHQGSILLIDCGLMFAGAEFRGTDLMLPDIKWLREQRERICAIVITHGHEDHIGALPFVLRDLDNPPIYATTFTLELIRARLQKRKYSSCAPMHQIQPREPFSCGAFSIEAFSTAHSIPRGVGLAISTTAGCIIHSGDFKLDPSPVDGVTTDLATLGRYADAGVLALLADSTNVEHSGFSASERDLVPVFTRINAHCSGNVFISTFSSNIHRIQLAITAAEHAGRKVVILGRGLCENINIAHNLGLLSVKPHTIIRAEHAMEYTPGGKLCIIASGCQGEPGSAMQRLAAGVEPLLHIKAQDSVVISARTIPGNEVQVNAMLNQLYCLGAKIYTGADAQVHVSGHACAAELRQLTALVKPQFFIPLHGEPRHLVQHAQLAQQCGVEAQNTLILRDGMGATLSCNGAKLEPSIPCTPVYIDMHNGAEVGPSQLEERKQIGRGGCIHVSVFFASATPDVSAPELVIHFSGINNRACHSDLDAQIRTRIRRMAMRVLSPEGPPAGQIKIETAQLEQLYTEIPKQCTAVCKKVLGYRPFVSASIHHP
ncbi:MAG: ribonuclease J [Geobacteraceae bacterium]|nr:ribonuclease J [Geobacteraceae bacterium]